MHIHMFCLVILNVQPLPAGLISHLLSVCSQSISHIEISRLNRIVLVVSQDSLLLLYYILFYLFATMTFFLLVSYLLVAFFDLLSS